MQGLTADRWSQRPTRTWVYIVALVAMSIASRLPQLFSRNLLVDGDEAVLGLMARHLVAGKEFPVFFWGQHYGLSSIEAVAAALSFLIAGTGAIPLKLAMLGLWTLGVILFFLTMAKLVGRERGFFVAPVFVFTPAWAVWSMKARGGYLTAFVASAALLWLLADDRERQTPLRWLGAGALTALVYLAQPLWLPSVLPIALVVLLLRRNLLSVVCYVGVIAAVVLLIKTSTAGSAAPPFGNADVPGSVPLMARQIYVLLTGAHEFAWPLDPPGPVTAIVAWFWYGVLGVTALLQLYRLAARRFCRWSHLLFLGIWATILSELVFLHSRDARYLLPTAALLVMLAGVELADAIDRGLVPGKIALGFTLGVVALGSASCVEFRNFTPLWANSPTSMSEQVRLRQLVAYLGVEGVTHVFTMNGLLDTQIMFYSDEKVISRWGPLEDRHPPYVDAVNRALAAGERVAVIGYTNTSGAPGCWDVPICTGGIERLVSNPEAIYTVDGRYFAYVGADKDLLARLHFRFAE